MLRFFRVEHCYSNRRRLPFIGIKGVGGIVATWKATIEKSHDACFYAAHHAPATETSLKHARLARFTRAPATSQDEQNRL